jgi:hypothetical protein
VGPLSDGSFAWVRLDQTGNRILMINEKPKVMLMGRNTFDADHDLLRFMDEGINAYKSLDGTITRGVTNLALSPAGEAYLKDEYPRQSHWTEVKYENTNYHVLDFYLGDHLIATSEYYTPEMFNHGQVAGFGICADQPVYRDENFLIWGSNSRIKKFSLSTFQGILAVDSYGRMLTCWQGKEGVINEIWGVNGFDSYNAGNQIFREGKLAGWVYLYAKRETNGYNVTTEYPLPDDSEMAVVIIPENIDYPLAP